MSTGSGLDAQIGFGVETTYGTAVTPTLFPEFDNEDLKFEPTYSEPSGLRAGRKFKQGAKLTRTRRGVSGSVNMQHPVLGMSRIWKQMLGSGLVTPTQLSTSDAYEHIHTPGDFRGKSMTIQVGKPEPGGTVQPHTYAGCKFSGWELSVSDSEKLTLALTVVGRDESTATALATAAYIANNPSWGFEQCAMTLGGTATTASGKTTLAGNTAIATIVNEIGLTGETPMAEERYGVGNQGLRAEPLENDIPTITGSLSAEYGKEEIYDVFQDNDPTAVLLSFEGGAIPDGAGENFLLEILIAEIRIKAAAPVVGGPDLVEMSTDLEAYSDDVNPVIQVRLVTTETTL